MARTTKEDYARHYRDFQGTPEQIKKRAQRNAARKLMAKKHGVAALAGKDVDHKKPIRAGGTNGASNLRLRSIKSNRGDTR
jgi:hypothetical protein